MTNTNDRRIHEADKMKRDALEDEVQSLRLAGATAEQRRREEKRQRMDVARGKEEVFSGVRIVDIDMPFMSMVVFMIKWAIASIPALVILMVGFAMVSALVAGFTVAAH